MAKESASKTPVRKGERLLALPPRAAAKPTRRRRWIIVNLCVILALVAGIGVGMVHLRQWVGQRLAFDADPPRVTLVNRPVWMTDYLAQQIIETIRPAVGHSALDQHMLMNVVELLHGNPWVRQVKQVRRMYDKLPGDTIEVDCEYRTPIAVVHWGDYYWLIDSDCVKLPEQYRAAELPKVIYGDDQSVSIRVIEGIAEPPPETGRHWTGADLSAAAALVRKLYGLPYTREITTVDASNFAARQRPREAQFVLVTRYQTEIRWGAPITERIAEVSADRKLELMKAIVAKYGRVDARHSAVDIRFDRVTFPSSDLTSNQANETP
jgi:hypothetical protein